MFHNCKIWGLGERYFFVVGSLKHILRKEATELINIVALTFVFDRLWLTTDHIYLIKRLHGGSLTAMLLLRIGIGLNILPKKGNNFLLIHSRGFLPARQCNGSWGPMESTAWPSPLISLRFPIVTHDWFLGWYSSTWKAQDNKFKLSLLWSSVVREFQFGDGFNLVLVWKTLIFLTLAIYQTFPLGSL